MTATPARVRVGGAVAAEVARTTAGTVAVAWRQRVSRPVSDTPSSFPLLDTIGSSG